MTSIFILMDNGKVITFPGKEILRDHSGVAIKPLVVSSDHKVIDGHVSYYLYVLTNERRLRCMGGAETLSVFSAEYSIRSFAVGDRGGFEPFVVALAEAY